MTKAQRLYWNEPRASTREVATTPRYRQMQTCNRRSLPICNLRHLPRQDKLPVICSHQSLATLDFNAEIELWTRAGHIKVNLSKGLDVRRLDRLVASAVLGNLGGSRI